MGRDDQTPQSSQGSDKPTQDPKPSDKPSGHDPRLVDYELRGGQRPRTPRLPRRETK
jgi:hypothetical protein